MKTDLLIVGAGPFGLSVAAQALWAEGRLKVEPWLESRLNHERVKVWPQTQIESCSENLEVTLTNGETFTVDEIVLATGYKVDITRLPYLAAGNLLTRIETRNNFPCLTITSRLQCLVCSSRACRQRRTSDHSSASQFRCARPPG